MTDSVLLLGDPDIQLFQVYTSDGVVTAELQTIVLESTPASEALIVDQPTLLIYANQLVGPAGPAGPPGSGSGGDDEMAAMTRRTDFVTDSLIYRGEAVPGASESALVWRIRRLTIGVDGDVAEDWAAGTGAYDKAWSLRASYTYG